MPSIYDNVCSSVLDDEFKESAFLKDIVNKFDNNCKDKNTCEISFNLNLLKGSKCYEYLTLSLWFGRVNSIMMDLEYN